jgi:DNA/RNA-binding domain of Phe-tRNA-synthetase-like protein
VLSGFRRLHDKIGRSNRRFPAASEALADLFVSRGIVPAINPIVDIYNLISLETRLSLGAHDFSKIHGNVTLRFTNGSERFIPLGASAPVHINAGEYCYIDDSNEILCRLEHKQVEKTKITRATSCGFFIIQGNPETPMKLLEYAGKRLADLLGEYCNGIVMKTWVYSQK